MTEGDASAHEPDQPPLEQPALEQSALDQPALIDDNLPGQSAIIELLRVQSALPPRSAVARLFGLSPLSAESRTWFEAAVSEIEVGDALARLDDDWVVLHALPVGTGTTDIDHVVIGAGGVFIINTKNHPGQTVWASRRAFLVSGIRYPYIRNMEYEMGRVERLLSSASGVSVEVSGILAIVAAKSITVREKHRDVTVLSTSSLVQWLLDRPVVLGRGEVVAIGESAELATTWHHDGDPTHTGVLRDKAALGDEDALRDKDALRESFAALRAQVRGAWKLQVMWATITTIVGAGGFVVVTYSILLNALGSIGAR